MDMCSFPGIFFGNFLRTLLVHGGCHFSGLYYCFLSVFLQELLLAMLPAGRSTPTVPPSSEQSRLLVRKWQRPGLNGFSLFFSPLFWAPKSTFHKTWRMLCFDSVLFQVVWPKKQLEDALQFSSLHCFFFQKTNPSFGEIPGSHVNNAANQACKWWDYAKEWSFISVANVTCSASL